MKKLKSSVFAKVLAIFLFCVFSVSLLFSAAGVLLLESWGAYTTDSYEEIQQNSISDMAWNRLYSAGRMYIDGANPETIYPNSNFRFAVLDAKGNELYSNKGNEKVMLRVITTMEPIYHITYSEGAAGGKTIITVVNNNTHETVKVEAGIEFEKWKADNSNEVIGYVLREMEYQDEFSERLELLELIIPYDYTLIFCAIGSVLILVLLLIFLLCSAGYRKDKEEISLSLVDKIPMDVFLVLATLAVFMPITIVSELRLSWNIVAYIIFGFVAAWTALALIVSLMSIAVRIKSKTLLKNFICVKVCCWLWKKIKSIFAVLYNMLRSKTVDKRWIIGLSGAMIFEFFLMALSGFDAAMLLFLWFINTGLSVSFITWCLNAFIRIRKGAKEMASGSITCSIDTKHMRGDLKELADDLMNIRDGINRAVNERMKSERFQTELITNVSHDIKTPLTSIVNYVDLLEKEELGNDKAKEYVQVLSRQSAKLKKLIADLIEASKASTGVLVVNPELCELGVLLEQCAGEYKERLEDSGLKLMLSGEKENISIMADGRHMWRILDNLMGNILKYAQPGTRVYLSLERDDDNAFITLRNISRDELNISGDELMERFVRGDASRSGEGSGLGLAIAKSLAQLQGGDMGINVDGDLFKVTLKFKLAD